MKRGLVFITLVLSLVACGTDGLEQTISEQQEKIGALETKVAELELELSEKELEASRAEMEDTETDVRIAMLNNIIIEYQEDYEEFNPDVAVSMYNAIKEDEGLKDMKDIMIGEMESDHQEMYGNFFDDIVELEELFE